MSGDALDLDALAALEQAATPGPWNHLPGGSGFDGEVRGNDGRNHVASTLGSQARLADAALIVALRNAAPALIEAARERDSVDRERAAQENFIADLRARRSHIVAERDVARAEVTALRERVEAVESKWTHGSRCDSWNTHRTNVCNCWKRDLRAALTTGGDQ